MTTVSEAIEFSESELARYERQIRIEGFGLDGQRRLKAATVLVSRVGGVGGTAAMNLARAGIGRLILAHGGKIVPEYLNRMQLALPADIGRPCTEVFVEKLRAINPDVELVAVAENISERNVEKLVGQADLIVDGAPLFEERYARNAEAVRQRKPLVSGAMYSTEGYVTSIFPAETACLACIYPEKPDYWTNINVFPAIGPGPVIVGSMLAMEVVKILTGLGDPLKNVLWYFDLHTAMVQRLNVSRLPACPVCGGASLSNPNLNKGDHHANRIHSDTHA